jgi:hypothetical protein
MRSAQLAPRNVTTITTGFGSDNFSTNAVDLPSAIAQEQFFGFELRASNGIKLNVDYVPNFGYVCESDGPANAQWAHNKGGTWIAVGGVFTLSRSGAPSQIDNVALGGSLVNLQANVTVGFRLYLWGATVAANSTKTAFAFVDWLGASPSMLDWNW